MRYSERGTTLTELLAVIALLAILLTALVAILPFAGQSWSRVERHTEMLQNTRRAVDKMVRDARAARWFQVVSPTLLRFVMALGDGTGATPTIEYRLNAGTGELEYRVAADFSYRRRVTVTAGSTAVTAGYSVAVTFDHASLVLAGKSLATGDDVRVLYWTGSQWQELDRVRDIASAWNGAATRLWFRLQTGIPASGSDANYYLAYGDPAAGPPPANGEHVFLDYEDGSTLGDWVRRDTCNGAYTASSGGFAFQSSSESCYRQLSRAVAHTGGEVFWGFRGGSGGGNSNQHQVGMGMRRSDAGAGYLLVPGEDSNRRLRIREVKNWTAAGTVIAETASNPALYRVSPNMDYYGRFAVVTLAGSSVALKGKFWTAGTAEPGWMLEFTDATGILSGAHYAVVNGYDPPQQHWHRTVVLRSRVEPEPTVAVGAEQQGARTDAYAPLAGPFRSMSVQCFNTGGTAVACAPGAAVRSVEFTLIAVDPTGEVADLVVAARAYRQAP